MIQVWPSGSVVTILPGGSQVLATPEDNDEYRATAARLGYGTDTAALSREHEILHSLLSHVLGLSESPTLRRVASGDGDSNLTGLEEQMVLAAQAFCRAAGIDLLEVLSE